YGIVKQNEGFINVYSEPGRGTSIRIYLPRCREQDGAPREEGESSIPGGEGETVLLVEDEPAILHMGEDMLGELGYRVLAASTPGEALERVGKHEGEIHLLVTDVVMPGMNGTELARNLIDRYPGLKCLFMSGYTANILAPHRVLEEGVHFIQKPFTVAELAAKVREVLEGE
ncbi:MAG: response regulator, partial [Spirochaetota bacterium]